MNIIVPAGRYCCQQGDEGRILHGLSTVQMEVFLPGRHPAPDVPLLLVHVKNRPRLHRQGGVQLGKALGNVFMYRTLADPELLRRLPHRRLRFNNVGRNLHRPLFNIIFQGKTPANIVFTMYAGGLAVMCFLSTPQIFSS